MEIIEAKGLAPQSAATLWRFSPTTRVARRRGNAGIEVAFFACKSWSWDGLAIFLSLVTARYRQFPATMDP